MSTPSRTPPPPSARPPGASRYGWFVGVVGLLVLVYIALNTLRTAPAGVALGQRLPPFAVPLLGSGLDGDANLATKPGPGAGQSGRTPACAVSDPRALNFCWVADGHPVVLTFASVKDDDTLRELDALQSASARFPAWRFVGVFLRRDRDKALAAARKRGWTFPLGWDAEGGVAAVYGVKALPATVFADPHRCARGVEYRYLAPPQLGARLRELERTWKTTQKTSQGSSPPTDGSRPSCARSSAASG